MVGSGKLTAMAGERCGLVGWSGEDIAMGIFYLNVSTVSRSAGRRATVAAAYCSRSKLWDGGLGREVDFSGASGLEHSEILLPSGAPARWADRATLWNEVEAIERRGNAQLAMEIEAVAPDALGRNDAVGLARQFMSAEFPGKVIDFGIHWAAGADGRQVFYLQALLPMREVGPSGFGMKLDRWHGPKQLARWRTRWVELLNERAVAAGSRIMVRAGVDAVRGRGLDTLFEGSEGDRSVENFEIAWRNGERLSAEPGLALDALTERGESFSRSEIAAFARRNTAGDEQYEKVLARIESSVDLVRLPGGERFSTRRLALRMGVGPAGSAEPLLGSNSAASGSSRVISRAWAMAGREAKAGEPCAAEGNVGSSRTLGEALALWRAAGLRVRGAGQTYEAAKTFERRTGIDSVGVHGLLGRWQKNQDRLLPNDVLVVDGARQLSLRQKEWMLKAVRAASARLALVDGECLVEIDGGAIGLDAEQIAVLGVRAARSNNV